MEPIIPYCVQRATFTDRPDKTGVDKILCFDYMGSSEFEFSALGTSLKEIRPALSEYDFFPLELNGKPLTVFCPTKDKDAVFEAVRGLAERRFRLKEYCDLMGYINPEQGPLPMKRRNDHWWDIDHHFMVWKENAAFTEKFKEAIKG